MDTTDSLTVRGHLLDPQQLSAVMDDADTQLVIAAVGTGKIIILVGKVKCLVREGVDPREILLISLTNNSVVDFCRAVEAEFGGTFSGNVMTIHSLSNRIFRRRTCVVRDRAQLIGRIMYDQVEIDRGFLRNLLLYVERLRTTGYLDLSLNGTNIKNRGLMAFVDALFEYGYECVYERPLFTDRETRPASITAEDERDHRFTLFVDDDAPKAVVRDPKKNIELYRPPRLRV